MKSRNLAALVALSVIAAACGPGTESADGGEPRNAVITSDWKVTLGNDVIGAKMAYRTVSPDATGNIYAALDTTTAYKGAVVGAADVVLTKHTSTGEEIWSRKFGTTAEEKVSASAVDDVGNIWLAGSTAGAVAAQPMGVDAWVKAFAPNGKELVSTQLALKGDQYVEDIDWNTESGTLLVATGEAGVTSRVHSVSSAGAWTEVVALPSESIVTVDIDGAGGFVVSSVESVETSTTTGPVLQKNTVVARYATNGTRTWRRVLNIGAPSAEGTPAAGTGDDVPADLAVSADGSLYLAGNVGAAASSTVDIGFLVKLDSARGTVRWIRKITPLTNAILPRRLGVRTVDVTDIGDVWLTGDTNQPFDVDYTDASTSMFAMKFGANGGQTALLQQSELPRSISVLDAALLPNDQIVQLQMISGGVNQPGRTSIVALTDRPAAPILDGADNVQQFGWPGADEAIDVAVGPDGGYFVAAHLVDDVDPVARLRIEDHIIAKGPGGNWDTTINVGLATGSIAAIGVEPDGSVVAAGTMVVGDPAHLDMWVTRLNTNGTRRWFAQERIAGDQRVSGLSVDAAGNILVTGTSQTQFSSGLATKYNAFASIYDPTGLRLSVQQWGGQMAENVSTAIPEKGDQFVVATWEEQAGDATNQGIMTVRRLTYAGNQVGQSQSDPTLLTSASALLTRLPDGSYMTAGVTPPTPGAPQQVRVNTWSADLSPVVGALLPKMSRMHWDCVSDLVGLPSGEVVVAGTSPCTTYRGEVTRNSGYLLRIDSSANVLETRLTGTKLNDTYTAVGVDGSGGYWVAGTMTTLIVDGAPGSGDVVLRHYPGPNTPPTSTVPGAVTTTTPGAVTTTIAPDPVATTVPVSATTGMPAPTTTAEPAATATTVAVSTEPTTVMTIPTRLDEVADQVGSANGNFSVSIGSTTVTGTVRESGEIVLVRPSSVPESRPFVTTLLPGHRSVTVTWSPVSGARSYTVTASGGKGQSCTSVSATCTVTGLVPGYPYQFVVTAATEATSQSDPSVPVKAVLYLGRNKKVKAGKVIPAPTDKSTKVTWKAKGTCKVTSTGQVSAGKKAGKCTVTRVTSKTKKSPATRITFTVVVR